MTENIKITNITDFLDHQSPSNRELVASIRELIIKNVPDAIEVIMWSTPWYKVNGKSLFYISTFPDHVNFGFAFGAQLSSKLLEGTGKNMRHVKIESLDDLHAKEAELKRLLKESQKA